MIQLFIQSYSINLWTVKMETVDAPSFFIAFSASMLLAGWQEGHPTCKKLSGGVLAWLCASGEMQICIWPS